MRSVIAAAAAEALHAADLAGRRALVGFDGFLDIIIDLVDVRHDMSPDGFRRIETLDAFARRVGAAAGKSTNIEAVTRDRRWGGNGPLLAGGVARLGMRTTYIGAVGREDDWRALDPAFAPFASLCERVVPIATPGRTDALEFADGKLMVNHCSNVQQVTWDRVVSVVGEDAIRSMLSDADLVGVVNWSLLGGVNSIFQGLARTLGSASRPPRIFIDLSDPAKRTDDDLRAGLALLADLARVAPVTLGLNLAEAERLARLRDVPIRACAGASLADLASDLRRAFALDCVVIHPREGAAGATASHAAWFDGPLTRSPRLSTGAGDHFNAGFAAAQVAGLSLEQCLAVGTAVSGAYVRDAAAPTLDRLIAFLRELPLPERD